MLASTEQTGHFVISVPRKYRADGSSRYLVPGSTQQTDHFIISVPASTEQMGRLGIWYLQVPTRWIIPSFQYLQVPSRWVVLISGTCKHRADGSFHHFSTRKYRVDGSSQYLVLASTEQMDHFIILVLASTEQMGCLGIWYP